jgi:hypothetical protein
VEYIEKTVVVAVKKKVIDIESGVVSWVTEYVTKIVKVPKPADPPSPSSHPMTEEAFLAQQQQNAQAAHQQILNSGGAGYIAPPKPVAQTSANAAEHALPLPSGDKAALDADQSKDKVGKVGESSGVAGSMSTGNNTDAFATGWEKLSAYMNQRTEAAGIDPAWSPFVGWFFVLGDVFVAADQGLNKSGNQDVAQASAALAVKAAAADGPEPGPGDAAMLYIGLVGTIALILKGIIAGVSDWYQDSFGASSSSAQNSGIIEAHLITPTQGTWDWLARKFGITRGQVRENLHECKDEAGLGATDNVQIDPDTGDIFGPDGEIIGNLIDGCH